jgi:hypothetical protein
MVHPSKASPNSRLISGDERVGVVLEMAQEAKGDGHLWMWFRYCKIGE